MKVILNFFAGIFIGAANVIPGVSGGTIAVILNAYEDLLTLTSLDIKKIRRRLVPLLCLCFGILLGVVTFSKLVTAAYKHYPVYTNFFFVGIILASLPDLFRLVKGSTIDNAPEKPFKLCFTSLVAGVVACAVMVALFIAKQNFVTTQDITMNLTFTQCILLFLVGVIAAIAMLMPGISGSFLLLLLGYYNPVMHGIANLEIPVIACFGCGLLSGLVIGSRMLLRILKNSGQATYAGIFGLVLGSLLHIFPFAKQSPLGYLVSALCIVAGAALIVSFTKISKLDGIS